MTRKRDLFALTALLAFSTIFRLGFCADTQPSFSPNKPLSFQKLGLDSTVSFTVCGAHSRFSAAPICFDVEVSNAPQSVANISLCVNASMLIPQVEREWGHRVGEEVVRKLTPADVQILEGYLDSCRAAAVPPTMKNLGAPTTTFIRLIYRTNRDGHRHADVERKEFYTVTEQVQQSFIKNFIGFKGTN